ncbi:hypothetical protein ScPMuIL_009723 [Solemya velum]
MSFFSKKGPTKVEITKQNEIKKNITREFGRTLKKLQTENIDTDGPVRSSDSANTICGILEAVFLHGLKNSVGKKIASYMYLTSPETSVTDVNFWSFVSRFLHKDVIEQLGTFAQIKTEIGMCRAWVRAALNDGLIESYVNAMLADTKLLDQYYSKTAYLRDIEQPEILKSYLKGLISIEFQLPCNSSILNNWTSRALTLSGALSDTPKPVIKVEHAKKEFHSTIAEDAELPKPKRTASPQPKYEFDERLQSSIPHFKGSNRSLHKTLSRSRASSNESTHSARPRLISSEDLDVNSEDGSISEYLYDSIPQPHLTSRDIEEIKRITATHSQTSSDCSSSTISCPDFGHYNLSPADYVTDLQKVIAEESETSQSIDGSCDGIETKDSAELHDTESTPRNENDSINTCMLLESAMKSYDSTSSTEKSQDMSDRDAEKDEKPIATEHHTHSMATSIAGNMQCETVKSDCSAVREVGDSLDNVISTSPIIEETSQKEKKLKRRRSRDWKQNLMPKLTPPSLEAVQPQLSSAEVKTVATSEDNVSAPRFVLQMSVDEESEKADQTETSAIESIYDASRRSSLGNSLTSKPGWSSAFETATIDQTDSPVPTSRHKMLAKKTESFGTLLRTYTPSTTGTAPSVDELIQELGDSDVPVSPVKEHPYLHQAFPSQVDFMQTIATEKGLDSQNYQCNGCKRPIGLFYGKPRVCTFDGGYYCFECHENDEYHIPPLIIHNWDFRKHEVSKKSLEFLQEIQDDPLLDLSSINPKLYDHVAEMKELQQLRTQLCFLKPYMFTCTPSVAEDFRRRIWPREHLYDSVHSYALGDLLQIPSGQLLQTLKKVYTSGSKHVFNCILCSQKGFICEICRNPRVIYPFQLDLTYRCEKCKAVYHKACKTETKHCPKCQRYLRRDSQSDLDVDSMDYAYTPP